MIDRLNIDENEKVWELNVQYGQLILKLSVRWPASLFSLVGRAFAS